MTPTNQADLNVTSLTDKGGPWSSFELQLGTPGLTAQLQADPGAESSAGPGDRFTHRFADLVGGHLELVFHKALKGKRRSSGQSPGELLARCPPSLMGRRTEAEAN